MSKLFKIAGIVAALAFSPLALAKDDADSAAEAATAAAASAPAQGVEMTASGDHVVKVNTGNEMVDAAGNMVARCAERSAAFKACDTMGGFKAMGCRKLAEIRYKDAVCPL